MDGFVSALKIEKIGLETAASNGVLCSPKYVLWCRRGSVCSVGLGFDRLRLQSLLGANIIT